MLRKNGYKYKILVILGISALLFSNFTLLITPVSTQINRIGPYSETPTKSWMQHDPISISNNADFEKLGFEGNGTAVNPYVIKDLSIHAKFSGIGISIKSTSVFFEIRNCIVYSYDEESGTGIYFEKVVNGVIIDNYIHTLAFGIYVVKSEKCDFNTNSLSRLGKSIYFSQSKSMSLYGNNLTDSDYGMHLTKTDFTSIISNNFEDCNYGILADSGTGIEVKSNEISGSFFGLYFHGISRSQSTGNLIHHSQYGLYYAYSQECNVSSSELKWNRYGVSYLEVDMGTISNNIIKSNSDYGLHIKNSNDINIISNIVFYNRGVGVYLFGVTGAEIHKNEIGFTIGSNAVDVLGSSIKGLLNNWDTNAWSGYRGGLNYSISGDRGSLDNDPHYILYLNSPSDLILEGPASGTIDWSATAFSPSYFSISLDGVILDEGIWNGSSPSAAFAGLDLGIYRFDLSLATESGVTDSDTVILTVVDTTNPEWIQTPEDQVLECGSSLTYQLEASDHYGITRWWVNNTEFSIDSGVLRNIDTLFYGVYYLEVRAYDPSDNFVSHVLSISVIDSILPVVDSPPDMLFMEGEIGHSIVWNVYDYNPVRYEIYKDGILIKTSVWTSDMSLIQYSLDDLPPGTFLFTVLLVDIAGNSISDDVQVTIEPSTSTDTTTTTTGATETPTYPTTPSETGTTSPTGTGVDMSNILTLSIVGIGIAAVVIVLFVLKKR
ncbi:MAG: nitrous oxide reductase family maturation protein NosD [Candidatus Thorarchaeota archaeon]